MTRTEQRITAMRELLTPPGSWTKGTMARAAGRYPCAPDDPCALCWCLLGAAHKVCDRDIATVGDLRDDLDTVFCRRFEGFNDFVEWQDRLERTHAEVLLFLDFALGRVYAVPPIGALVRLP